MRPVFDKPPVVKMAFPVGSLMDIPTGEFVPGTHGQMVLQSGISLITGIVGPGNCFKTTIMRYMVLSALATMYGVAAEDLHYLTYDTEINTHESRNMKLSYSFDIFKDKNIIDEGMWTITDKTQYLGNDIWAKIRSDAEERMKSKGLKYYSTAFLDRDGKTPFKTPAPWFTDIDSLSQLDTADVEKIKDKTELGDSDANTIFMRQGLSKKRLLDEMPSVAAKYMNYFLFTAHIGKEMNLGAAPGSPPPRKQLQHMPNGEVIKGVTGSFFYLLHNCWLIHSARPLINKNTKAPEYPFEPGNETEGDTDLNIVTMRQLRGKHGASGFQIEQLVSQADGVIPYMSEFHYLRTNEYYGLLGNDRNYSFVFKPDVSLSRTTVRKKLRESKALRRACYITSQIAQMYLFMPEHREIMMHPDEIYKALKDKGVDWDWLLENTRGWSTLEDEISPDYPLSTLDLIRWARGTYHPYWLADDCKTIKPEFKKQ